MGRKKLKQNEKKERLVLFVKSKHLEKIKTKAQKLIEEVEGEGS